MGQKRHEDDSSGPEGFDQPDDREDGVEEHQLPEALQGQVTLGGEGAVVAVAFSGGSPHATHSHGVDSARGGERNRGIPVEYHTMGKRRQHQPGQPS